MMNTKILFGIALGLIALLAIAVVSFRVMTTPSRSLAAAQTIAVDASGAITLNGSHVTLEELRARLRKVLAQDPQTPVLIHCDSRAPYNTMTAVLDLSSQLGLATVGLAGPKTANQTERESSNSNRQTETIDPSGAR